jgi:hypothetical protein
MVGRDGEVQGGFRGLKKWDFGNGEKLVMGVLER